MHKITPCLWFNGNAPEALEYYKRIFKDFKLITQTEYGPDQRQPEGTFLTAVIEVLGQRLMLLNGDMEVPFTWAVSFIIHCNDQTEIDYYWENLTADGGTPIECGWLKDKYGLNWQVTPNMLLDITAGPDKGKANRVFQAMLKMKKIDIATLEKAAKG